MAALSAIKQEATACDAFLLAFLLILRRCVCTYDDAFIFGRAVKHRAAMLSLAKRIRETVTPARKTSAFLTQGVLTPEEFVEAGEQLVFKCPTWTW